MPDKRSLVRRVASFLRDHVESRQEGLVVGVSGGVDSMVLFDVLVRLGLAVHVAHVNYQLRGSDSDADEALVRGRCEALGVPFSAVRFETKRLSGERKVSVQEVARDLRYAFFEEVARREGTRFVAVAHHADDQAETLLLNLFRGTGIDGLCAMPTARPLGEDSGMILLRPFLGERRTTLMSYARRNGVPWREDAGNDSVDYQRSALRLLVLPEVKKVFDEGVPVRLARTARYLRAYRDEVLGAHLEQTFTECTEVRPDGGVLRAESLAAFDPAWRTRLILEALRRWVPTARRDFNTTDRIDALLESQVGRTLPLDGGTVWREREGLHFSRSQRKADDETVIVPLSAGTYRVPGGHLVLHEDEQPDDVVGHDPFAVVMNPKGLGSDLRIRYWTAGDRMQPFGMEGHRKISDLLTDTRVPSSERPFVPVMLSQDEIVWVMGVRLSERVRVRPETGPVWRLRYIPDAAAANLNDR